MHSFLRGGSNSPVQTPSTNQTYPVKPGDWILTEDGERLYFRAYSLTHHWGFFRAQPHQPNPEYKLPLAGLRKAKD